MIVKFRGEPFKQGDEKEEPLEEKAETVDSPHRSQSAVTVIPPTPRSRKRRRSPTPEMEDEFGDVDEGRLSPQPPPEGFEQPEEEQKEVVEAELVNVGGLRVTPAEVMDDEHLIGWEEPVQQKPGYTNMQFLAFGAVLLALAYITNEE